MARLIVGIDLALRAAHRAIIYERQEERFRGKAFAVPRTFDGLQEMMGRFDPTDEVEFVLEPTGNAWRPVAAFLVARGYPVYLVRPDKSAALRKFYSRHTKSNRVDAATLAKIPVVDPEGVHQLTLPTADVARLRDLCRQRDRLVSSTSDRKRRIEAKFDQLIPTLMDALRSEKFTLFARKLMRKYSNPFSIKRLGRKRFARWVRHRGASTEQAQQIFDAAASAVNIYAGAIDNGALPFDFDQSQQEIRMELDLIEAEEKQIASLESQIEELYHKLDPERSLETLPGVAHTIAPAILAETINAERFPNVASYRCFVSLIPKQKQTGGQDPGQPKSMKIRKSGARLLKKYFYLAAETARKTDAECAAVYYRLKRRGRHHTQALCAVAGKLASRAYAVLTRMGEGIPAAYQPRDLHGKRVTKARAKELVGQTFQTDRAQKALTNQAAEKNRERAARNLDTRPSEDASKKRAAAPLPIGDILQDIIQGAAPQPQSSKTQTRHNTPNNQEDQTARKTPKKPLDSS